MPTILTKSPFLPPDFQPPGTAGQAPDIPKGKQQYEFRGVYELGGVYHYNLYNTADKKGHWVTDSNTEDMGFNIVEFDSDEDSLQLIVDGEPMNLSLVETSDKPMAIARRPAAKSTKKPATQSKARRRVIRPKANKKTSSAQRRVVSRPSSTP